ncbi:MAG TPA: hypothetical protein VK469_00395 [Candidatus Kapabacteria bacterium]|nr:hypothetical protein [Candidatus Kapabacteria bacterium]
MKKFAKIMMILVMLLSVGFSIFNFLSIESKAVTNPLKAAWVYSAGEFRCMGDGNDCTIGCWEPIN